MIDALTQQLFGQFPREVANPSRSTVRDLQGIETFLIYNEGIRDCYISLYPLSGEITSILFELDGYARALEDAKLIYNYLCDAGHIVVPVVSGKKGIHLYLLLRPKVYGDEQETKKLLYYKTYSILYSVFGEEDYNQTTCDTSTIGDIRQIIRIPNTRRPGLNSWCTYLPPEFGNYTWYDIIMWSKMPHHMPSVRLPRRTLDDIEDIPIKIEPPTIEYQPSLSTTPSKGNGFLEGLLRPCLYRSIIDPHPKHVSRVATTIDLLQFWSPQEVLQMYSTLGWLDWDTEETRKQIASCVGLHPYHCPRLKQQGVCFVDVFEDCPLGAVQTISTRKVPEKEGGRN